MVVDFRIPIDGDIPFSERMKAARKEAVKQQKLAMAQLSPDEAKYAGGSPSVMMAPTESYFNKPEPVSETRPAKRQLPDATWKKRQDKVQRDVEKEAKKRRDEDLAEQLKEFRRNQRSEPKMPKADKPARDICLTNLEGHFKPIEHKYFEPVIGTSNAAGETSVKINRNTTILVAKGRDIQKVIANYQRLLNIKKP